MNRYFFIDKEIYFQNKKMPDRKVELFNVRIINNKITQKDEYYGNDEDGNSYIIPEEDIIIEEEKTKIKETYYLREKGHLGDFIISGTLGACENKAKELRNRNLGDKYDEYWQNVELEIIKKISTEKFIKEV